MALRAEESVDARTFSTIRRRALIEGCKWDPQVGDSDSLCPFPLILRSSEWKRLASQAEQLTAEAIAAEEEISRDPALIKHLGFPRPLSAALAADLPVTPAAGRVIRFDFHHTTDGWRISEANSDVPGGFTEASYFTDLMAGYFPQYRPAGNPGNAWSAALADAAGAAGAVALLSAPGYMEDHQVVAFLAARLRERGCDPHLAQPAQITWRDGRAHLDTAWHRGPLSAIVRFYQAEWLARMPRPTAWRHFFRGGITPVANPALAVISESKRFPLTWDHLSVDLPTWRALLPETRDPRDAPWYSDDGWLLKTAMCNTGDAVSHPEWTSPRDWLRTKTLARLAPKNWIAQRRFHSIPISTPAGPLHPCIGVYTVNGSAAGIYGRLSKSPLVNFASLEVAVLLDDDD